MRPTRLFTSAIALPVFACGFPVGAVPQAVPQPVAQTASDASKRERLLGKLKGATYRAEQGTIRLKAGSFQPAGGGFGSESTWLEADSVVFAQNPDTAPVGAAVILNVDSGGTATWPQIHAVRFEKGVPRDLGYVALGDRVGIKQMSIQGNEIIVNMVTHGPDDPSCCPTLQSSATYRLAGSTLVRKVSDQEVEDFLQQYEGAVTKRMAVETTLALDPQAKYALKQLSDLLEKNEAAEKAALAQIHRYGLRSDPRFKTALRNRLARHKKVDDAQDPWAFARATQSQKVAIFVLGEIINCLQRLQ